jgi:hypothetical protein
LIPDRGRDFFSSSLCPDWLWGPLGLLSNGYQGLFTQGIKQAGCEPNQSPPSSAKVKNVWSYTSTPYVFMALDSVKHKDNFMTELLL